MITKVVRDKSMAYQSFQVFNFTELTKKEGYINLSYKAIRIQDSSYTKNNFIK